MSTAATLRDQLAELRMAIDRNDPVQVEAEAAFASMVTRIMREAEIAEHISRWRADQLADHLAQLMKGTAEAHDAHAEQLERRQRIADPSDNAALCVPSSE